MGYRPLDYMDSDGLLRDDEIEVRASVRKFVDAHVVSILQRCHRDETFPKQLVPEFAKLGLLGPTIEGYGCAGLGPVAYGLMMQELERADSGIRSFCSVQGSLVMHPISAYGSEEQKQKYLPALAKGEMIGCFGLTESDAGSNPGAMRLKAEKVKQGYRLNGHKMWITNGGLADVALVWAKLDGEVRGFLVDRNTPGFQVTNVEGKLSLRVSVTSELHFDDCIIPDSQILPGVKGLKGPLSCLSEARFGIAWGVIGAAQTCLQTAIDYASTRTLFDGKVLSEYQLAQAKLVSMATEITKAQLLVIQLGRLKENNQLKPAQISMAKMNNCRMALDSARTARDILGGNGILDEYPIMRHLMNLETVNTYEGTEDIHRLVVGLELTGKSAIK